MGIFYGNKTDIEDELTIQENDHKSAHLVFKMLQTWLKSEKAEITKECKSNGMHYLAFDICIEGGSDRDPTAGDMRTSSGNTHEFYDRYRVSELTASEFNQICKWAFEKRCVSVDFVLCPECRQNFHEEWEITDDRPCFNIIFEKAQ